MEQGSIVRVVDVLARPDLVFAVVSQPEHVRNWWSDEATFEPVEGRQGELVFRLDGANAHVARLTVVDVDPPRRFAFRWVYDDGVTPGPDNSLLVTFDLEPVGEGTRVTMTETGFRERGWALAELEEAYRDHSSGWDFFMPRLAAYVPSVVATR